MRRFFLSSVAFAATFAIGLPAWADKIAILPFTSPNDVPRPELEEVRRWTREAVVKKGHSFATDDEMVAAEAAVKDGVADTTQEYQAAGKAIAADWTLTARVERIDHPPETSPDGTVEEGYASYRVELEAYQMSSGRLEALSREVLAEDGPEDLAEMLALLVRAEGIDGAELPWLRAGARRPTPKPKSTPTPEPEAASEPRPVPSSPALRPIYGADRPIALGASIGVTNALVRPDNARGPSWAMPIGVAFGYALPESAPGLELKANFTGQVRGPRAVELSGGARYALAPLRGVRIFVGPELLVGAHVALGADKVTRFLTHGSLFLAYGITKSVQAEIAGDLAAAFGGAGTLVLGGGTARVLVRF